MIEADWVVVGGGSAGSVVASRLSEDPAREVVLLEAGPDWRPWEAPEEVRSLNGWRPLDEATCGRFQWPGILARRTPAQPALPYVRGRGLGGSSVINGMFAIRAVPDDYDRWEASGCAGWSYAEMLPLMRGMEADTDFGDEPYHGSAGPIPVERLPREHWEVVDNAIADAALALGYGWTDDHNAPTGTGVSPAAFNARDGARVTTNDAYIEPARQRPNLRIVGDATVDRVLFEGDRAVGVRVRTRGEWSEVRAHGVVLCAGSVHSPAILLRSGIGPEGPLIRLPVGQGVQDHALAILWLDLHPDARVRGIDLRQANCCIRYSSGLAGAGENDMMLTACNQVPGLAAGPASAERAVGTWGGRAGGHTGGSQGLMCLWAAEASSRGSLRVTSADPDVAPTIELNLLGEEFDRLRMRDGFHRMREMLATSEFGSVVARAALEPSGRDISELDDDASIDRWLLSTVGDSAHLCGSCRMGPAEGTATVVDPAGRVLGTNRLWVADASIFPAVPRANTHLPTIVAAEQISESIRRP